VPEYNKLVRDKIPEIITANGEVPITRVLHDDEYEQALIEKIAEEQKELSQADTTEQMMEELADIQATIRALAKHIGSVEQLDKIELQKAAARGVFENRIFLVRTE
jgi:predicted house-cleaning noncanonical NTP pyrophosphatase (MazG superfamily)